MMWNTLKIECPKINLKNKIKNKTKQKQKIECP